MVLPDPGRPQVRNRIATRTTLRFQPGLEINLFGLGRCNWLQLSGKAAYWKAASFRSRTVTHHPRPDNNSTGHETGHKLVVRVRLTGNTPRGCFAGLLSCGRGPGPMLVELSVVEHRYHAVMEVLSAGAPVVEVAERGTGSHARPCTAGRGGTATRA